MNKGKTSSFQHSIDEIKARAVDKFVFYLSISAVFAYLASISRVFFMGWQPVFYFQTFYLVVILVTHFFRKKLNYKIKLKIYLVLGVLVAAPGLYTFGFMGGAVFIVLLCPLVSLFFLDKQTTILITTTALIIYLFCAYSFLWGGNELPVGESNFIYSIVGWGAILVDAIMFFTILGLTTIYFQRQLTDLLEKLEHKNDVIEAQKKQIEYLVDHDALTGLLSLRAADIQLDLVLEQAKQKQHYSALLFLDLDGFKAVNDTHGHDAGDLVLRTVAERIKSSIRAIDKACRVGGDEFLIIVNKFEKSEDISNLCTRLIQEICVPVPYKNFELTVSCSIGAAAYPCHAKDANNLRIKADESMYKVKKTGKNNYWIAANEYPLSPHYLHI